MERGVYEVWHMKEEILEEFSVRKQEVRVTFPRDYERVALVTARNLDQVLEKTSSYDQHWWDKRGVECVKGTRSIMVGDIVISPDQDLYQLASEGLRLVNNRAHERAPAVREAPERELEPRLVR